MSEPIAQVGKPVQLTWRNRRATTKENSKGEFFCLIQFEFDEEAWGFLKTIPRNANGEMVIWVTDVGMAEEKPKKPPKEKTPHGDMWRELFLSGFIGCPGLREAVTEVRGEAWDEKPRDTLRRLFGVESLSREVGPDEIYSRFPPAEYPAVEVMVKQALRKANKQ